MCFTFLGSKVGQNSQNYQIITKSTLNVQLFILSQFMHFWQLLGPMGKCG